MKKIKNNKAFSLLELAIVMVIIGLLSVGVTAGNRLIKKARLARAQMLTQDSLIFGIGDVAIWLETSLNDSIDVNDSNQVTAWNDLGTTGHVLTKKAGSWTYPVFSRNTESGVPALELSDTSPGTVMETSDSKRVITKGAKAVTTVIVAQIPSVGTYTSFFYLTPKFRLRAGVNYGQSWLSLYVYDSSRIEHGYWHSGALPVDASELCIYVITLEYPNKLVVYQNGSNIIDVTTGFTINNFDYGDVAEIAKELGIATDTFPTPHRYAYEIIVFEKTLSTDERQDVEEYLAKKYNIKLL